MACKWFGPTVSFGGMTYPLKSFNLEVSHHKHNKVRLLHPTSVTVMVPVPQNLLNYIANLYPTFIEEETIQKRPLINISESRIRQILGEKK